MKILSTSQLHLLHRQLMDTFGGLDGIRDEGLLAAAAAAPFQTFDGEPLYPTLQQKAARLGFGLVGNHPFLDGNKRLGAHAMLVFLELNGITLTYQQEELYHIILAVAAGEKDAEGLLQWILAHEDGCESS